MVYSIVVNNKDYCMYHPYVIAFATKYNTRDPRTGLHAWEFDLSGTHSASLVVFSSVDIIMLYIICMYCLFSKLNCATNI